MITLGIGTLGLFFCNRIGLEMEALLSLLMWVSMDILPFFKSKTLAGLKLTKT